jgi:uncharacterized protein with von Willebrand factor type A (vWA) domain
MNFQEFIDTGKLDKFRKVKIDLTDKKSDGLVEEIAKDFELSELLELRELLNKRLQKEYRGKLKIDYCLAEDYINTNNDGKLVKERLKNRFRRHLDEANDKVAKAKTEIERKISSMLTDAPSSR